MENSWPVKLSIRVHKLTLASGTIDYFCCILYKCAVNAVYKTGKWAKYFAQT
jgi:hypothetical protein